MGTAMEQQVGFAVGERASGAAEEVDLLTPNRYARWARICGLLALVPFALVFGVIGLRQVRRTGQRGRGLAITGLVAALVWALVLYNVADALTAHVERDRSGGVSATQVDQVWDLRAGDCFTIRSRDADGGIQWVVLVPCDQQHDGKVYATPELKLDPALPAEAAAKEACTKALPADTPADTRMHFLYPDQLHYSQGHSQASCFTEP